MSGKFLLTALLIGFLLVSHHSVAGHEFSITALQNSQPDKPQSDGGGERAKENVAAKSNAPGAKKPGTVESDAELENRINIELRNRYKALQIRAEVTGGIIRLKGEVADLNKREEIVKSVKRLKGVDPKNVLADFTMPTQGGMSGNNVTGNTNQTVGSSSNTSNAGVQQEERKNNNEPQTATWWDTLSTILYWLIIILGALLAIALLAYAMRNFLNRERARIGGHFKDIKTRQDNLSSKLDSSVKDIKDEFGTRIAELQEQVLTLKHSLKTNQQEVLEAIKGSGTGAYNPYGGYTAQPPPKENTFPVSAEEYLRKMSRGAVVVKPDFQNGILVQDPEEKGELMLVQDSDVSGGLFYVVPKVGYFQTKADFYNYYDKYYRCHRPSVGEVWIIEPAVVDRVSGGWELRVPGELEIK